ncbi:hypothetical protein FKM82_009978 [Ascaphus truei]
MLRQIMLSVNVHVPLCSISGPCKLYYCSHGVPSFPAHCFSPHVFPLLCMRGSLSIPPRLTFECPQSGFMAFRDLFSRHTVSCR